MSILDLWARLDKTAAQLKTEQPLMELRITAARDSLKVARAGNGGLVFPSGALVNDAGCDCVSAQDGDECMHQLAWRIWTAH